MSAKDSFRLDGKVALISGAARGIGAAIAASLHEGGAKVVIADILIAEGEATAAKLGAGAAFIPLDVTQESDWEAATAFAVQRFGGLNIVANNAGIELASFIADMALEDFNRLMSVNAAGVFLGTKHAIRCMRPGGASGRGGSIINTSSIAGIKAVIGLGAYSASKGAVRLLTKAAAIECGRFNYGIRVNSIHPGLVKTEMGTRTLKDYVDLGLMPDEAAAEAAFVAAHLVGLGQPQDVANGVRYLASDAARWVTGIELVLDGGFLVT